MIEIRTNQLQLTLEIYHDSGDGEYTETEDIWIKDERFNIISDEDWEHWRQQVKEAIDIYLNYKHVLDYRLLYTIELFRMHSKVRYTLNFLTGEVVRKERIATID